MKIIVATANSHKLEEIKNYFSKIDKIEVLGLKDLEFNFEIPENGKTFLSNAQIKAQAIFDMYPDYAVLADDSGFCVRALNDEPGIFSARYLGDASASEKNESILEKIKLADNREAYFACAMVLKYKNYTFETIQYCYGTVAFEQKGEHAFGYDPIFIPNDYTLTFAQDPQLKARVSHRTKALKEVFNYVNYITK